MAATSARKPSDRKPSTRKPQAQKKAATEPQTASRTYTVEDDVLHYTTKAGHELAVDLDFSPELIKMIMGTDEEDRSEDEQFDILAGSLGENFREAHEVMGVLERRRIQTAIFLEFQKAMGLPLGESSGSSRS